MPLLATFIGTIASAVVAVLSRIMAYEYALKFAAYTAWIAVFGLFVSAVFVCISGLRTIVLSFFGGVGIDLSSVTAAIVSGFGMGLGMFIPSNAATVLSCMASVWIACQIYKVQKQGMHNYAK